MTTTVSRQTASVALVPPGAVIARQTSYVALQSNGATIARQTVYLALLPVDEARRRVSLM